MGTGGQMIELELVATQPRELGSGNGGVSLPFLVKFLYCGLLLLSLTVKPSFSLSISSFGCLEAPITCPNHIPSLFLVYHHRISPWTSENSQFHLHQQQFHSNPSSFFHGWQPTTLLWSPLWSTSHPGLFFQEISLTLIHPHWKESPAFLKILMCLVLPSPATRDHDWVVAIAGLISGLLLLFCFVFFNPEMFI